MQQIYGDDVVFVGIAGRGDLDEMVAFVDDGGVGGFDHVVDADGALWQAYGVATQPAWAFVDDGGSLTTALGGLGEEGLTERVEALLAG